MRPNSQHISQQILASRCSLAITMTKRRAIRGEVERQGQWSQVGSLSRGPHGPGRQCGFIGQCFQPGPRDLCVHAHAEAAVCTRNPFRDRRGSRIVRSNPRRPRDARRRSSRGSHIRNQDLALWYLHRFPDLPLVFMATVGDFYRIRAGFDREHDMDVSSTFTLASASAAFNSAVSFLTSSLPM